MKKILLITCLIAVFAISTIAYASYSNKSNIIVSQYENLIKDCQKRWKDLDREQKYYEDALELLKVEKEYEEDLAALYRETIEVLNNNPVGVNLVEEPAFQ